MSSAEKSAEHLNVKSCCFFLFVCLFCFLCVCVCGGGGGGGCGGWGGVKYKIKKK